MVSEGLRVMRGALVAARLDYDVEVYDGGSAGSVVVIVRGDEGAWERGEDREVLCTLRSREPMWRAAGVSVRYAFLGNEALAA